MKQPLGFGLGVLLFLAVPSAADPPTDTSAAQMTTQGDANHTVGKDQNATDARERGVRKSDGKKQRGAAGGKPQKKAQTSIPDGSTISENGTSTSKHDQSPDDSTVTTGKADTTKPKLPTATPSVIAPSKARSSGGNGLLVSVLIVTALTLTAVTASVIELRRRITETKALMEKVDSRVQEQIGTLLRDLSPLTGVPSRVQKIADYVGAMASDIQAIHAEVTLLKKKAEEGGAGSRGTIQARHVVQTVSTEPYEYEPSAESSEDSIHDLLRQLASDCLQSPMTESQARARARPGWAVSAFGAGDLPEGFVVDTGGRGDAWFIPNTRRWSALRREALFDVVGPDLPTAQIVRIDILPRVRRVGGGVKLSGGKRGRLEISIA